MSKPVVTLPVLTTPKQQEIKLMKITRAIAIGFIICSAGLTHAWADTHTSTEQCAMTQSGASKAKTGKAKGSCCKEGSTCKADSSCCTEGSSCCASDCCKAGADCCAVDGSGCKADASCCSGHSCCSAKSSTE